jgi:hypothetical protein
MMRSIKGDYPEMRPTTVYKNSRRCLYIIINATIKPTKLNHASQKTKGMYMSELHRN